MTGRDKLEKFWVKLTTAPESALLLDYDGTLAPFRPEREKAYPYPGVREVLEAMLDARCTRMVLITGRRARDLAGLLNFRQLPEIWGSHGIERLTPDGRYKVAPLDEGMLRGLDEAFRWAQEARLENYVERKPGCIAVHFRGLEPEHAAELRTKFMAAWTAFTPGTGLGLHEFDGGLELRSEARNKGDALRAILSELRSGAVVAYLGDDQTDEDAFRALKGKGLGVLVQPPDSIRRTTSAQLRLRPPGELIEFLKKWNLACSKPGGWKERGKR